MRIFYKLSLIICLYININILSYECDLYLAPSFLPNSGYGIFTGKNVTKGTKLISDSTIIIDQLFLDFYQISNYFYRSVKGEYAVGAFGPTVMINHLKIPNLQRIWSNDKFDEIQNVPVRPYTTYRRLDFDAKRDLVLGEELFTNYGGNVWFTERNITYDPSLSPTETYTTEELEKVGHCLSNVYVDVSKIPMAGKGLFANRNFSKGELVTISPILTTPLHQIKKEGASSLFLNYVMTLLSTDLAFLPTGFPGMLNHGGKTSNLEYQWYDIKESNKWINHSIEEKIRIRDKLFESLNIQSLTTSLSCDLYLGYYATRDIQYGEELTINYGDSWENEYLIYLDVLEYWLKRNNRMSHNFNIVNAPQFRHSIEISDWNFLPREFLKFCVGSDCSKPTERFIEEHKQLHDRLNSLSISHQLNLASVKQSKSLFKSDESNSLNNIQTCSNINDGDWYGQTMNKVRKIFGLSCV